MRLRNLLTPEYLYRPSQILRRVAFKPSSDVTLHLPWNCTITACSTENIGRAIATQGLYDLTVTEALMRLTDAGETTLDVGANIGYMSLVLALSAGRRGRVVCFEPNTDLLPRLETNVNVWKSLQIAPIEIKAIAVSDRDGEGRLGFPSEYRENFGIASLEVEEASVPVKLYRLDSLAIRGAGVMKVDVEGHEAAVFFRRARLAFSKADTRHCVRRASFLPGTLSQCTSRVRIPNFSTDPFGLAAASFAAGGSASPGECAFEFSRYSRSIARREAIPRLGLAGPIEQTPAKNSGSIRLMKRSASAECPARGLFRAPREVCDKIKVSDLSGGRFWRSTFSAKT